MTENLELYNEELLYLQEIHKELQEKTTLLQKYSNMILMLPTIKKEEEFEDAYKALRDYRTKFDLRNEEEEEVESYLVKRAIDNDHSIWIIKERGFSPYDDESKCTLKIPLMDEIHLEILGNAFGDYLTEQGYRVMKVYPRLCRFVDSEMYLYAELEKPCINRAISESISKHEHPPKHWYEISESEWARM